VFRDVGIASRALVVLGVGLLAGCDCYQSEGTPDESDASVDASVDAAVETDAGADAGSVGERCPGGEPSLEPEELVETHEDGCWTITTFDRDRRTGDPELAVTADGTVHIVNTHRNVGSQVETLRHLTNAGGVWQYESLDCADLGAQLGDPRLAVASSEMVHVAYRMLLSPSDGSYMASNESGAWVVERAEMFAAIAGLVMSGAEETEVDVIGYVPGGVAWQGDMIFGRRDAAGAWTTEPLPPAEPWAGRYPRLAARGDATYVLSENACPGGPEQHEFCRVNDRTLGYRALELATNESGAWVVSRVALDLLGNTQLGLAVTANGDIHCLYPSTRGEEVPGELVYGVRHEGEWSFEPIVERTSMSMPLAMVVDGDGAAHLIYGDTSVQQPVPILRYLTNRTGEWVSETVPVPGGHASFPSLVLGADGSLHLALNLDDLVYVTRTCP
jgi:hypothetical protein